MFFFVYTGSDEELGHVLARALVDEHVGVVEHLFAEVGLADWLAAPRHRIGGGEEDEEKEGQGLVTKVFVSSGFCCWGC